MSFRYLIFALLPYFIHPGVAEAQTSTFKVWEWDQINLPSYGLNGTAFGDGLYVDIEYDTQGVTIANDQLRYYADPINPTPPSGSFNFRSEIRTAPWRIEHPLGTEQWIGWRYTFGDSYKIDPTASVIIYQNHPGSKGFSPTINIEIAREGQLQGVAAGEIQIINNANYPDREGYGIAPKAGESLDIVVHVIYGQGSNGLLQVWLNGNKLYDKQIQTVYDDLPWGGNNKWGIYKHSHRNQSAVQNSLDAGVSNMEIFMGTLKLLTRTPADTEYGQDAYDLVTPDVQAPQITSQPQNLSVTEGQSASFNVTATGTGPLSYQWQKDGVDIQGATLDSYTIGTTSLSDGGAYRVLVSNTAGSVTSNPGTLTVTQNVEAPQITSQPQDLSVTEGQSASFNVTATGTG
ncbi:MAG: heparin lyase I family protein, partial [Cyclobacteriaceae bacterium]